jgi:hypothetical protein
VVSDRMGPGSSRSPGTSSMPSTVSCQTPLTHPRSGPGFHRGVVDTAGVPGSEVRADPCEQSDMQPLRNASSGGSRQVPASLEVLGLQADVLDVLDLAA